MSKFFINRPIFAIVIALMISAIGLISMVTLPIAKYPQISPPQVRVSTAYSGANAEVISQTVAEVVEKQMIGVDKLVSLNSTSNDNGTYSLTAQFELGSDSNMDMVNTQNRVSQVTALLPSTVQSYGVTVQKATSDMAFMFALYSPNGTYDDIFMGNYATKYFMPALESVAGFGSVNQFSADYAMRVWMNPSKMEILNVTPTDIMAAIGSQNVQAPVGTLGTSPISTDQQYQYTLRTDGRLATADQFKRIVIRVNSDGTVIHLEDVADVELGANSYNFQSLKNGANASGFMISLTSDANAIQSVNSMKKVLENASKTFPSDMKYQIMVDTTEFVYASLEEVGKTFFEALALVALIVFVFLQNWRATLIPMIAVPVSLLGTFAAFTVLGFTINTLTLFAMVLAIGLLVDDAIVVIEAVEYEIMYNGQKVKDATITAMNNVQGPVVGIACVLSAVFIPVAFLSGMTGVLYKQFALTVAVSVMFSAFIALTLTPALCATMLKPHKATDESKGLQKWFDSFNRKFDAIINWYGVRLAYLSHHLKICILFLIVLSTITAGVFRIIPTGFVPAEDNGYFISSVTMPEGTTLAHTNDVLQQLGKFIEKQPGISRNMTVAGFNILASSAGTNAGVMFTQLTPWDERKTKELSIDSKIKQIFGYGSMIPQATIMALNPPPIPGLGMTDGFTYMLESKGGASLTELSDLANKVIATGRQNPAIGNIYTSFSNDTPGYQLDIDKEKVEKKNVSLSDVYTTLQAYYGSAQVNDFTTFGKNFKVVVQAAPEYRKSIDSMKHLYVRSSDKTLISLDNFTIPKAVGNPSIITRYNNYPAISISGTPANGYSSGDAIKAMEEISTQLLPAEYGYEWSGQSREEKLAGNQTMIVFALAMMFVFLVLAALYESWKVPFSVLLSVPTGLFGATIFIYLFNETNNIYFQIGLLTVIGLAAKNAILIVEYAKVRVDERGMDMVSAAIEAAKIRLRPIIMTSLAFVVGCIPLALSTGAGAASRVTMGITVVFGTSAATLFGIFIIPMLFIIIENFGGHKRLK